jgi:hypothetical protein
MTQRSGCDVAPFCISLMMSPDELEAMITGISFYSQIVPIDRHGPRMCALPLPTNCTFVYQRRIVTCRESALRPPPGTSPPERSGS